MSIGVQKKGVEQGHWIYYHNNGAKWTEGDYRDGIKVGVWKVWYDNGKEAYKAKFKAGREVK